MKYLFGPVPSRRLGISLGVDLVPLKYCSLNCIYCEVGKTTNLTIKREEYIPITKVKEELKQYLSNKPELDFVTFSGQGEPTLNSGLGNIIDFIKDNFPAYKVAVITNGTLFWQKEVREEVKRADVILPSLDEVSENIFYRLNRPNHKLEINKIMEGLIQLGREFKGKIYLEIFFVPGLNDSKQELEKLKNIAKKINPNVIQLNTLDRKNKNNSVETLSKEKLIAIKEYFQPLRTEIIAKAKTRKQIQSFNKNIEDEILETIKRRPCTDVELSQILNIHINELNKYLSELIDSNKVESIKKERGTFFKLK